MTTIPAQHQHQPTVLLLKSESAPEDKYAALFSDKGYRPVFQPVLDHHFHAQNLSLVRSLLTTGQLLPGQNRRYGGLIFTSQRAVEAFGNVLAGLDNDQIPKPKTSSDESPSLSNYLPLYVVGPATSSLLSSVRDKYLTAGAKAEVLGSESGNGDNLARFILEHYNSLPHYHHHPPPPRQDGEAETRTPGKLPLLFLTGEQRRDAIPKTLMSESLPLPERIPVHELVVYEAGVKADLEAELGHTLHGLLSLSSGNMVGVLWVVLFSPGSCAAVLSSLRGSGLYADGGGGGRRVYIATIGPTTRDHLQRNFGIEADVCAERPSPEGLWAGIQEVMARLGDI